MRHTPFLRDLGSGNGFMLPAQVFYYSGRRSFLYTETDHSKLDPPVDFMSKSQVRLPATVKGTPSACPLACLSESVCLSVLPFLACLSACMSIYLPPYLPGSLSLSLLWGY